MAPPVPPYILAGYIPILGEIAEQRLRGIRAGWELVYRHHPRRVTWGKPRIAQTAFTHEFAMVAVAGKGRSALAMAAVARDQIRLRRATLSKRLLVP